MSFTQLKVSHKLIIGFASMIAFSIAVGVIGVTQLKKIDEMDTMLYEKGALPLNHMGNAGIAFQRIRINLRDILRTEKAEDIERYDAKLVALDKEFDEELAKVKESMMTDEGKRLIATVEAKVATFEGYVAKIKALAKAHKDKEGYEVLDKEAFQANKEFQEAMDALEANKVKAVKAISDGNTVSANWAIGFMVILLAVGSVGSLVFAFFISKSITDLLTRVSDNLRSSSDQVASAASQLSEASTTLSSASSEQASAIEETSSSLEELNGMVQANVGSAEQAFELATRVKQISEEGNATMTKLENAMQQILESNGKIEALVSVIGNIGEKTEVMDEIVFQTKLLSFNASVEAERAGEHGRGFAVVAQEVGNLAQMSGKAAQEIAAIVKDSISNAQTITTENRKKVDQGNVYVAETSANLKEIMGAAGTVASGAKQVLDASKDQAKGITQISTAMTQVDKATQENAATAEEAASSSQELTAQTEVLHEVVGDLMAMVHGQNYRQSDAAGKSGASGSSGKRRAPASRSQESGRSGGNSNVVKLKRPSKFSQGSAHGGAQNHTMKKAVGYDGPTGDDNDPDSNAGASHSAGAGSNDPWEKL